MRTILFYTAANVLAMAGLAVFFIYVGAMCALIWKAICFGWGLV